MTKKNVTIIGCGATGLATAAWYEMQGLTVTLCDAKEEFEDFKLIEEHGILSEGAFGITEPVPVHRMTTDICDSVKGAEYIIVCVSGKRQNEISSLIAPVLKDGQAVLFTPGNLGAVCLRRILDAFYEQKGYQDKKPTIISAETSGNLWACRITKPGCVVVALPAAVQKIAAYPAADTRKAVECFEGLLKAEPAKNVIEAVLNSPNLITHLAGTLLNVADIERKKEEFALFEDGLSETVISVFRLLERERNAVLSAYGLELYNSESCEVLMRTLMQEDTPEGLRLFKSLKGPSSMQHRYISEDAPYGTALLVSMARAADIAVPIAESLLTMASAVKQTDYYKCGRTLNSMNFSKEEIKG